jgi:hypothetical protein
MKKMTVVWSYLGPVLVIGGLLAFVGYALWLYHPDTTRTCHAAGVQQQFDIAVHVVRQWFGRESQLYVTCPEG